MPTLGGAAPEQKPALAASLPQWYAQWARELADLYFSGTVCLFVLHGNVHDLVCDRDSGQDRYRNLVDFLSCSLFGSWDVILRHDLGHGLRPAAGSDRERLQRMIAWLSEIFGTNAKRPAAADELLPALDRLIQRNLLEEDSSQRRSLGLIFEYAEYLLPASDLDAASRSGARLVRFQEWARNPLLKRVNIAFILIAEKLSEVSQRLIRSPYVAAIEIPMPDEQQRLSFIQGALGGQDRPSELTEFTPLQLARMANGLTLSSVDILLSRARRLGEQIDQRRFGKLKKQIIERQCQGLIEFIEPAHTLDLVVGHDAAKQRLRQDADFIGSGRLDTAPMGYLVCGPVGTGKTFLAECYAGSIGIPCVRLKNFRSKYVGETEGNLERVLSVLRSLGPVVVMIDEADAALGTRQAEGDSGTSSRVFSMIAAQMGDTNYRGRIIWMLLTSRPDLLPIDLKRQGRAEVHIPLFYPHEEEEIRQMFAVMARKNGIRWAVDSRMPLGGKRQLSGADIESIVLTANRLALSQGRSELTQSDLSQAMGQFIPSSQGLEKEMQEVAAVLECTQLQFLPPQWQEVMSRPDGRSELQNRLVSLRGLLDD